MNLSYFPEMSGCSQPQYPAKEYISFAEVENHSYQITLLRPLKVGRDGRNRYQWLSVGDWIAKYGSALSSRDIRWSK